MTTVIFSMNGIKHVESTFCKACGEELYNGKRFCDSCHTELMGNRRKKVLHGNNKQRKKYSN